MFCLADVKKDPFLKIVEDMHNQTLKSGGKATFKCKVDGYPKKNLIFTWYALYQLFWIYINQTKQRETVIL